MFIVDLQFRGIVVIGCSLVFLIIDGLRQMRHILAVALSIQLQIRVCGKLGERILEIDGVVGLHIVARQCITRRTEDITIQ